MRKLLALIMALLMTLSFIACAADVDTPPANDPASDNETTVPQETDAPETTLPPETEPQLEIPDVGDKYKGTEFVILHRGMDVSTYTDQWNFAKGLNGETINDAVFKRNAAVEEKFGITIKEAIYEKGNSHKAIEAATASNDDLYDIAYPRLQYIRTQALQGAFYNLLDEPFANILGYDKPWWDGNINEAFSYKGKLFVAVSDFNLNPTTRARATIFNRDLAKKYKLDDPYELVKNNEWTLDKFAQMVTAVSDDANGNSQWDEGDVYGMLTEVGGTNGNIYNFVIGAGVQMFPKDKDGNISIGFMNERTISVLEKCSSFFLDPACTRSYGDIKGTVPTGYSNYTYGRLLFSQDHFLFYQMGTGGFSELIRNNMESEYGIVPRPKFDASQERYYNQSDVNTSIYCVPATNDPADLERIAIVSEFMAYTSSKTVLPAYYETLINLRLSRVPEMGEMVDIIKNSIYYDITTMYGLKHAYILDDAYTSGSYGSSFESAKAGLEALVTELGDKLAALDN